MRRHSYYNPEICDLAKMQHAALVNMRKGDLVTIHYHKFGLDCSGYIHEEYNNEDVK